MTTDSPDAKPAEGVPSAPQSPPTSPTEAAIHLKPRPRLFIVACVLMASWIAALIIMFFATVYPNLHKPAPVEKDVNDHSPATMLG